MLSEEDVKLEINEALTNKGWKLTGKDKNVFLEENCSIGRADYVLRSKKRKNPLVIIEAKRRGKDLNKALEQAQKYARELNSPIAYASDGSTIKTVHLSNLKPLMLNGEEIDAFVNEVLALQFLNTNEHNTLDKKIIKSRQELINIFAHANKELRKEGLQAGVERFSEFCNILFLKLFSEEEDIRHEQDKELRINKEYNWSFFKNKDGDELLSYVNDTVLRCFQKEYGADIFTPLQIKNPRILKSIIDNLDTLSLVDTNSDIKGDAFEYFLKAYLAKESKDLGEYFTPRHIVKTLVKLVNPKFGETVYDPFCGTGGILIESFKHIYNKMPRNEETLQRLKKDTVYGAEITKNAKITKMNMILTGDGHNNITKQDSLQNPSSKKYDVVITNMPFSLGKFNEYAGLYSLGNSNGDSLCIEHCFDAINPNSGNPRIGIIIPEGILFDKNFKKLREYMYKHSWVQNIVSLPFGAFKPYADNKTNILYLTKVNQNCKTQKSVWHYTVKNDGYTLNTKREKKEGENDLDVFLSFNDIEDEDNLLHIGFNKLHLEEIKNNDYISIPSLYKKFEFNNKFENIALGKLIEESELKNNQNAKVWSVTNDKGFISAEDRFDEQVASKDTKNYKIILPRAFAYNPSRINVGSIAFNNSKNVGCVSPMYTVFKIVDENLLNPKYLYWLLQSKQFKQQVNNFAFGSVRQTVNFNDFKKIIIPLPKTEEQQAIVEELENYQKVIDGAKQVVKNVKPQIIIKNDWDSVRLGDIATFEYGYTDSGKDVGKYRFIRITDINDIGFIKDNNAKYIDGNDGASKYILKDNDILVARTGSYGKTAIFSGKDKAIFASYLIRIHLEKNIILPKYYLGFSQTINYWQQVNSLVSGTSQPQLNANVLRYIQIPIPSLNIQRSIIGQLEKETSIIEANKELIKMTAEKIQNKINSLYEE